jgi:Glycosyltransferase family 92
MGDPEARERFLRYAALARGKPAFDAEERDYRLDVAAAVRAVTAAASGGDWIGLLDSLLAERLLALQSAYSLINVADNRWLRAWANADAESLRRALAESAEEDAAPEAIVSRFEQAASKATAAAGIETELRRLQAIGSLLAFAADPGAGMIVRAGQLDHVRTGLGLEPPRPPDSAAEAYRESVAFVKELGAAMARAGIEVRDPLDAQSLAHLAGQHHEAWATGDVPERSRRNTPTYLALCAIYRDEAPYLREWVEFHRLVGVERFFLYDNDSTDDHLDVLAPYIRDGIVTVRHWPVQPGQAAAYNDSLHRDRDDARWIAFVDVDEFLFSPNGTRLPELLADFEQHPGVGVNCALFGPSGHEIRPPGLVTESYGRRLRSPRTRLIKSVVDPALADHCAAPHHFVYRSGLAVDENGYPIKGAFTKSVSMSRLRVNHYVTKSMQELRAKSERVRADTGAPNRLTLERLGEEGERDESIGLWLPPLRDAIARPRV